MRHFRSSIPSSRSTSQQVYSSAGADIMRHAPGKRDWQRGSQEWNFQDFITCNMELHYLCCCCASLLLLASAIAAPSPAPPPSTSEMMNEELTSTISLPSNKSTNQTSPPPLFSQRHLRRPLRALHSHRQTAARSRRRRAHPSGSAAVRRRCRCRWRMGRGWCGGCGQGLRI